MATRERVGGGKSFGFRKHMREVTDLDSEPCRFFSRAPRGQTVSV